MKNLKVPILLISLLALLCIPVPALLAQDAPPADAPAEKVEKPADEKSAAEAEVEIGKKLDADTVTEIVTDVVKAIGAGKDFWRTPSFWEAIWLVVLVVLGLLAAHFGWKKKKWAKIIQAVEKGVNTVYVEFIREAKATAADGKLTNEQMKEALDKAWQLTKDDLLKQGIDLAKWITREYFPVVVDKILKAVKKK